MLFMLDPPIIDVRNWVFFWAIKSPHGAQIGVSGSARLGVVTQPDARGILDDTGRRGRAGDRERHCAD
jgi:hypothetical protein